MSKLSRFFFFLGVTTVAILGLLLGIGGIVSGIQGFYGDPNGLVNCLLGLGIGAYIFYALSNVVKTRMKEEEKAGRV